MNINLYPDVSSIKEENLKGNTVVVIDVLRATSVITTALYNGCLEVVPVLEVHEALSLKGENVILGGERKGLKIEGFDFSNSPLEYTKDKVEGKRLIFTTTNGTKAIVRSRYSDEIFIGCMLNAKFLADYIVKLGKDISIVCAGTNGIFSMDDFLCAGKIIYEINKLTKVNMSDFSSLAYLTYIKNKDNVFDYLKYASHYRYMLSIGLEEDIKYCFQEDILDTIPYYKDGKIKRI
ncbi:2-phosphosulfolactate phosphatase [Thermobrachium celere]|uniref:Probable 2-phosphosulfolactate phosphatase n=1 Tax=Thermobrachium celere DSM 8682 TaxID=941824 RepID=R7RUD7_9CLOT|nr:2-phosphosulfolactate phosphatase [Thermobrachium celere]GFR35156.1 putative 2-phosphosulfolactate phosphatase [Thermobrachium celere]CDF59071.1 Probable 2-phosphosulfolactate phosphatase [Thermobrachium celere DSM 8682]